MTEQVFDVDGTPLDARVTVEANSYTLESRHRKTNSQYERAHRANLTRMALAGAVISRVYLDAMTKQAVPVAERVANLDYPIHVAAHRDDIDPLRKGIGRAAGVVLSNDPAGRGNWARRITVEYTAPGRWTWSETWTARSRMRRRCRGVSGNLVPAGQRGHRTVRRGTADSN